jgi:tRNA G10  N-methylase Trm11
MLRAAEQYGVRDKFLDLFTFDVTQNPLRRGGWVDSIVTDPPCKFGYSTVLTNRWCEGRSEASRQETDEKDTNARWTMSDARRDVLA